MSLLTVELRRQARRRRTLAVAVALVGIPVLLAVVLLVTGGTQASPGQQPTLVDIATLSGANFALFSVSTIANLLLIIVVALVAGDPMSSEASWGSLRYLLVRPVARGRLLSTKLSVAVLSSLLAVLVVPVVALTAGTLCFGWHGLATPLGSSLSIGASMRVLALTTGYIATQLAFVAGVAFWFSVRTDAPLGAVGGAVLVVIVSNVLDAVTSLGAVRDAFPTHYAFAWFGLLQSPQQTGDMVRGIALQIPWTVIPLVLAWRRFGRADILS